MISNERLASFCGFVGFCLGTRVSSCVAKGSTSIDVVVYEHVDKHDYIFLESSTVKVIKSSYKHRCHCLLCSTEPHFLLVLFHHVQLKRGIKDQQKNDSPRFVALLAFVLEHEYLLL
jgi:hypothetical protein